MLTEFFPGCLLLVREWSLFIGRGIGKWDGGLDRWKILNPPFANPLSSQMTKYIVHKYSKFSYSSLLLLTLLEAQHPEHPLSPVVVGSLLCLDLVCM